MRFGSTAKVLLKCKLKYYRISQWDAVPEDVILRGRVSALGAASGPGTTAGLSARVSSVADPRDPAGLCGAAAG